MKEIILVSFTERKIRASFLVYISVLVETDNIFDDIDSSGFRLPISPIDPSELKWFLQNNLKL